MKLQFASQTITTFTVTASDKVLKYNRLLSDLNRSNRYFDSLQLFTQIHSSRCFRPDHYTLSTALAACANFRHIAFGSQLHAHAVRSGLKVYSHVANTLLSLYAKAGYFKSLKKVFHEIETPDVYSWTTLLSACVKLGHVEYANEMFDKMPKGNVACWNAVITGFAESGNDGVAINMFCQMHKLGIKHDNYSFACILSLRTPEMENLGRQVHSLVIKSGYMNKASVTNALLTMYFHSENLEAAYGIFGETEAEVYDQITYNVMIDGLVSIGRDEEALIMFRDMQQASLSPTELTLVSIMSSCSFTRVAQQMHSQAVKLGFETFTSVGNATITMYSSCGEFQAANAVFHSLEEKDIISWNAIISCYVQGKFGRSAVLAFIEMQRTEIEPDEFTFGSLLGISEFTEIVEMAQAFVVKNGLILMTEILNALVSAYSKCGKVMPAYQIFNGINSKNLISWNTIIYGFLLNGLPLKGLEYFSLLMMSKLKPNAYTLSIVLSICASISAMEIGKQIHSYILRSENFSETSGEEALRCFKGMQEGSVIKPDQATFTTVLSACGHAGLVDEASRIFDSMLKDYNVIPSVDQLSCIVDLLGRSGYIDEAERMIESAHFEAHTHIWWALFSACAAHGNLRLGRTIAGLLLEKEDDNPSVYVLLSNIYATAGCWEEAASMRELMKETGAVKQPGCSWIG